jgi:polysaccharide biosynthesis transport protein
LKKVQDFARRWWIVGLGAALGLAIGLTLAAYTPKSYTATVTLFVGSAVSPDSSAAYNLDLFSQQRTLTYSKLTQNRDIAVKVIQDLGLTITPEQLSAKMSATPIPKTVLMKISATDSSAVGASQIANMFTNEFAVYVSKLETPAGSDHPSSVVTVVQTAEPPTAPTSPNIQLFGVIGLVGGLLLGLFVKWLMQILDRRVRTSKQVVESTDAPVLGVLPRDSGRRTEQAPAYTEAVRKLRANLLYTDADAPPKTIAFVSPTSTVSTTATATNLAFAFDATGRHVALIDADMGSPRVARYIGGSDSLGARASGRGEGLSSVLAGDVPPDDALVRMPDTGVDILLGGAPSTTAREMLATDALAKLFAELRSSHDFVLCDTPGLLTTADAAEICRACDGVLLVVEQGKAQLDQLSETAQTLRRIGANVIGAVLTDAR